MTWTPHEDDALFTNPFWEDALEVWGNDWPEHLAGPEYLMAYDIPWYYYREPDFYTPRARFVSDR